MAARRLLSSFSNFAGVLALATFAGCQQPAPDVDGHKVTRTKQVDGKTVNILEPNQKDMEEMKQTAKEMKKTADGVAFTPAEQQAGK